MVYTIHIIKWCINKYKGIKIAYPITCNALYYHINTPCKASARSLWYFSCILDTNPKSVALYQRFVNMMKVMWSIPFVTAYSCHVDDIWCCRSLSFLSIYIIHTTYDVVDPFRFCLFISYIRHNIIMWSIPIVSVYSCRTDAIWW